MKKGTPIKFSFEYVKTDTNGKSLLHKKDGLHLIIDSSENIVKIPYETLKIIFNVMTEEYES